MGERYTYEGQCHCGAVRLTVTTDLGALGDCNCSRCRRLGWIMQSVAAGDFALLDGADKLKSYRFNTEKIEHLFCSDCGIESFARGTDGAGAEVYMVNFNCLESTPPVDAAAIKHWDGRNW
jgi:hypothetical protein